MACAVESEWYEDEETLPDGAHWDEDCPVPPRSPAGVSMGEAFEQLHHQAHGPGPMFGCRARPCSQLDLEQLRALT